MRILTKCFLIFFFIGLYNNCCSQQTGSVFGQVPQQDSSLPGLQELPSRYYSKINKKISSVNDKLTKKSLKYLAKFQRQEQRLRQKLEKLHPELIVANAHEKYSALTQQIKSKTDTVTKTAGGEYNPYLDSLGTSLSFLKQYSGINDKVKEPFTSFNQLQNKLQQSEKIKEFIAERKIQINEMLSKYTTLPAGLKKPYTQLNKTAYYYSAQVKEYKDMLKDPDKMEKKVLSMLRELPAFQKFIKENSTLSGLFNLPGNYGSTGALAGLQTREQVEQLITNRMGGGPNVGQLFGQQVQAAQQELQQFKDKLNMRGSGSGDIEMPDFKPNGQKTKSFAKRLEYGFNVQFGRNNSLIPSTAEMALSLGYKPNDKSVVGVGISYKLGIGSFHNVQVTNQGLGLRSFVDYKIKKQFYLSGGYEMNYNSAFKNIAQLKNYSAWQKSGLIGVSKKYKISKKVEGNMQVLYDLLAHTHIPVSQAIIFRTGYTF